ncbi:hypothetical protein [Thalassobellus suaedae]|uniref:Uncharacterized protein n=1 Tax=Thalassobellus suaedae TaxID=3074124 RepID=A0ABY9XVS3_9FLAO|nr:hypothetical protein RHP51_04985 [Flavobacteriaceae bacterium HL-DH14]
MKKYILIATLLFSALIFAQAPIVNGTGYIDANTAKKAALVAFDNTKKWIVFDTGNQRFEYWDGDSWESLSSGLGGGSTNLIYASGPTNGTVNSDTGTDATIPLVDGTNAGLLSPSEKTLIASAIQTAHPTLISAFTNDSAYVINETDPVYMAWDKDYGDLINIPTIPTSGVDFDPVGTDNGTDDQTASEVVASPAVNLLTDVQSILEDHESRIDVLAGGGADGVVTNIELVGTTLVVDGTGGAETVDVDLSPLQDGTGTDSQTLSFVNPNLSISGGNSVDISVIDTNTTDHTLLSNIGTNSHAQIDTHIADGTKHFTQAEISITESQVSDLGVYLTAEVDGSTENELQIIANTSDATSHTATLSNTGGSLKLVEGSNITLTTSGTGSDGVVTIASTGGTGHTIQASGVAQTDRAALNFKTGFTVSDNAGNNSTDIDLDTTDLVVYDPLTHSKPARWVGTQAQYDADFPGGESTRDVTITDGTPPPLTTSGTGTAINMSGIYQYNFGAASSAATFTMTDIVIGGYAEVLVNKTGAPTVTGATQLPNTATFIDATDMILCIKDFNGTRKYWFVEF